MTVNEITKITKGKNDLFCRYVVVGRCLILSLVRNLTNIAQCYSLFLVKSRYQILLIAKIQECTTVCYRIYFKCTMAHN